MSTKERLSFGKRAIHQLSSHAFTPAIQAPSHRHIAHRFSLRHRAFIQEMLDLEQPAVQVFDLRQLVSPGSPLRYDALQAGQLLGNQRAHWPFFGRVAAGWLRSHPTARWLPPSRT